MTKESVAQCSVDGCLKTVYCKQRCRQHYDQWLYQQPLSQDVTCKVIDCNKSAHYRHRGHKGYCGLHYLRMERNGSTEPTRATPVGTLQERFWQRVNKNGGIQPYMNTECWEWTAGVTAQGYGIISEKGIKWTTHRLSWYWANQKEPTMSILHECDNKKCVNPDHLREGTHKDNKEDERRLGTLNWGEKVGGSKLTANDVRQIRVYLQQGMQCTEIAQFYNVGMSNISAIKTGRSWKDLK